MTTSQIQQLSYELENPILREDSIKFGIFEIAYKMMSLCENFLITGNTGYYHSLGCFQFEMVSIQDWKIFAKVWKWLCMDNNNKRKADIIAYFS